MKTKSSPRRTAAPTQPGAGMQRLLDADLKNIAGGATRPPAPKPPPTQTN